MNNNKVFSIFCWNIGNPSLERAKKQADWLLKRLEDVFVLTETKGSDGCNHIKNFFENNGYNVVAQDMKLKDYGTMIINKNVSEKNAFANAIDFLPSRVAAINLNLPQGKLEIIGLYVPSRNADAYKIRRKKIFTEKVLSAIKTKDSPDFRIVCGDFNVLEPNHYPHYSFFQDWEYKFYNDLIELEMIDAFRFLNPESREYSWVGRTGDGYRYDHIFVSNNVSQFINKCFYEHNPREIHLSDHSGVILELNIKV